ncbi:MAG: V-type ATP synthase subunit F [Actinobacteria bacterium HGW-Actinobacteria-1]|nr:MAG: V-type ATP synthase subunit F [Actinobacteria bacterium HGW-Actinobacteria-1]
MQMAQIAIVGDSTSVAGFRPLGFAVFPVERAEDARELWNELAGGEYGVVFVTEPVYSAVEDLVAEVLDRPVPAVTIIPGAGSSGGVGGAKINRAIERALGTSMLIREEEE